MSRLHLDNFDAQDAVTGTLEDSARHERYVACFESWRAKLTSLYHLSKIADCVMQTYFKHLTTRIVVGFSTEEPFSWSACFVSVFRAEALMIVGWCETSRLGFLWAAATK